jgi:hypothetical protein
MYITSMYSGVSINLERPVHCSVFNSLIASC